MRILKREIDKRSGSGWVKVRPEESEDLWHLYHLIRVGDAIKAVAVRRVHKESATGHTTSERVKMTLEVTVDKVDFDPQAATLRLKGTNRTESPFIKLGASQTLAIELNRDLTLIKSEWDQVSLKRIHDAADPSTSADAAAIVMDEGIASVCLLKANMTITVAAIDVTVPRKRRGSAAQHDKGLVRFFESVLAAIEQKLRLDVLKVVLVASPGFVREAFLKWMWETVVRLDKKPLLEHKAKFVAVHATSGYKHALAEVLASPEAAKLLVDTKFAVEVKLLARFTDLLRVDPGRAYYGFKHVHWANQQKAVETLLITDELFRAASVEKRREYIELTERVKQNGGAVHVFSALHVSGEQLQQLTGVAAILRYPLAEPDDIDAEDSTSSDSSDASASDGSFNAFRARQHQVRSSISSSGSSSVRADPSDARRHQSRDDDDDNSISITDSDDDEDADNDGDDDDDDDNLDVNAGDVLRLTKF
jgi:protein pelota